MTSAKNDDAGASFLDRLLERPKSSVCLLVLISIIFSGSFYSLLIITNTSAQRSMGTNPWVPFLTMSMPYAIPGAIALIMTLFSRLSAYSAVHATMIMMGASLALTLLKLPYLGGSWSGDMDGLSVFLDLAVQFIIALLALPVAYLCTRYAFREQRPKWALEKQQDRESRKLEKIRKRRHW